MLHPLLCSSSSAQQVQLAPLGAWQQIPGFWAKRSLFQARWRQGWWPVVPWAASNARDKPGEGKVEGLGCVPHCPHPQTALWCVLGAAGRAFPAQGHLQGLFVPQGLEDFQEICSYPKECLEKPLRELRGGAGGATGAIQEGKPRCETRPGLPDQLWQHLWVGFYCGYSREVGLVKPSQCGVVAMTISGIKIIKKKSFCPILCPLVPPSVGCWVSDASS